MDFNGFYLAGSYRCEQRSAKLGALPILAVHAVAPEMSRGLTVVCRPMTIERAVSLAVDPCSVWKLSCSHCGDLRVPVEREKEPSNIQLVALRHHMVSASVLHKNRTEFWVHSSFVSVAYQKDGAI